MILTDDNRLKQIREAEKESHTRMYTENTVEEWLKALHCPVLRVDGTKMIEENVRFLTMEIRK